MSGVIGVPFGRIPIVEPGHTNGSCPRSTTRSPSGISALPVMRIPSVQHSVTSQQPISNSSWEAG